MMARLTRRYRTGQERGWGMALIDDAAYQVEVDDLGEPVAPCLSWCSISMSASAKSYSL
jgi:hypothetical protein